MLTVSGFSVMHWMAVNSDRIGLPPVPKVLHKQVCLVARPPHRYQRQHLSFPYR
jgi:hypothetical protein